ncbi:MAG: serine hydrolase domain-containing protein [Myxococcota bacterium]
MIAFLDEEVRSKNVHIHGEYDPRFAPVADVLRKQVAHFGGGAAASVYFQGECVVDIWAGRARHDGTPWDRDTMSICFSGTKGVAATAIHILASDGLIEYDAPVAMYWPEFGCNGKESITVRQVLAHQAGLHKTGHLVDQLTDILDWDLIVSRLAEAEPDFHPGTANGYHAITFGWLVGELVHRVSGQYFPEFVQERIVKPLALDGLHIGEAHHHMDRMADLVGLPALRRHGAEPLPEKYGAPMWLPPGPLRSLVGRGLTPSNVTELFTHPAFWKACLPSMNGVVTARSLAKMYAALSLGGELDGVRLVDADTVARSAEVQMKAPDRVVGYPLHWRLGYHRADALIMNVPSAFGHFGVGGAGGWANPNLQLSAALSHNGFPFSPTGQVRTTWLTAAVYESLGLYRGVRHTLRSGQMLELMPSPEEIRRTLRPAVLTPKTRAASARPHSAHAA